MKILIVDDEMLARERLQRLLAKVQPDAVCLEASDGLQALAVVESENPELLLLDIRMPGMDGIEVVSHLDALQSPPAVIFCTAYDEYALQALQYQAMAYLLKPVREQELADALATAGRVNRLQLVSLQGGHSAARAHVSSHTHRGFETMPVADIRCFLAEQKYVTAYSPAGELLIPDTLKELEQEFDGAFVRVHRNALVAIEHIERLERIADGNWRVVLRGVESMPAVSRRHVTQVKQRLGER